MAAAATSRMHPARRLTLIVIGFSEVERDDRFAENYRWKIGK